MVDQQQVRAADEPRVHTASVVIIGTGFAGLGAAIKLKQAGVHDFVVLEKDAELGGTWRDNTYPGCACDVPSLLYSFSFEQNPEWSRVFAGQQEISDYLQRCADKYGIREHIHYGAQLTGAEWDDSDQRWLVRTAGGAEYRAKAVVSGLGGLHIPSYPNLPGLDDFRGEQFHSARWNHDYDLEGKRVAVIGTGASAIQFVPQVAKKAAELQLFQRTPPWIQPKPDWSIPKGARWLFRRVPLLQSLGRAGVFWLLEVRSVAVLHNRFLQRVSQWLTKRFIRKQIPDPELRAAVTPDYSMGCKRILLANDYYPALNRSNVELRNGGVRAVTEKGVVAADGTEYEVDAIIFGTGFHVTDAFDDLDLVGRDGLKLKEAWADGMKAHLGITLAGFPNFFFLQGPNTGLGHSSVLVMIEQQINFAMRFLPAIARGEISSVDVHESAQEKFVDEMRNKLSDAVWSEGGCNSWYLDSEGRNTTLWPGFSWQYWLRTRTASTSDYEITRAG